MKKRLLASLLTLLFAVSLVPLPGLAAHGAGVTKTGGPSAYLDSLTIGGELIKDCTDEMKGDGWRVDGNVIFLLDYDSSGIIIDAAADVSAISVVVTTSSRITDGLYGIQCSTGLYLTLDGSILDINAGYIGIACTGGLFFQDGSSPGKVNITCGNKAMGHAAISQAHRSTEFMTLEPNIRLNINWVTDSDKDVHGLNEVSVIKGDSSDRVGTASVVVKNAGTGGAFAARTLQDPNQSYLDSLKSRATVYNPDPGHLYINMYGIDTLDISVAQPAVGELPSFTASASPDLITITEMDWCRDGPTPMSEGEPYQAGHTYQPVFSYKLKEGAEFLADAKVNVNGFPASSRTMYLIFGREYTLSLDQDISSVSVFVTEPVAGARPDFTASTGSTECSLTDGQLSAWIDTATGALLSETDAFESGHTYRALVWLKPNKGKNLTNATEVTINGKTAVFDAMGGSSASYYYDFAAAAPSDATHTVNAGSLTVREGPDTSSARIGGLSQGDEVKVVETQGEWSRIEYQAGYGWVMSKYLTALEDPGSPTYTIGVQNGISFPSGSALEGDIVTITADTPPAGQSFDHWDVISGSVTLEDAASSSTTFTMPAGNVVLCAVWKTDAVLIDTVTITGVTPPSAGAVPTTAGIRSETPNVEVSNSTWFWDNNGSSDPVGTDPFEEGKTYLIGIYLHPSDGYAFADTVSATVNGMVPESHNSVKFGPTDWLVLIEIPFAGQGPVNPFQDVSPSDLYYDSVLWAYYHDPQITDGMTDTTFGPELTVTRGQCVTFLWRAMGKPMPSTHFNPFQDVAMNDYYYDAVLWAVEKGITNGVTDTTFAPNATLSTQHIVTFLYRTLNPGEDGWNGEAAAWAGKDDGGKPFGVDIAVNNQTDCPRWCVVQFLYKTVK